MSPMAKQSFQRGSWRTLVATSESCRHGEAQPCAVLRALSAKQCLALLCRQRRCSRNAALSIAGRHGRDAAKTRLPPISAGPAGSAVSGEDRRPRSRSRSVAPERGQACGCAGLGSPSRKALMLLRGPRKTRLRHSAMLLLLLPPPFLSCSSHRLPSCKDHGCCLARNILLLHTD
jgi:hypothetical protein